MKEIVYHTTAPRIHSMPGVVCSPWNPMHIKHPRGARRSPAHELLKLQTHKIGASPPLNYWLPKIMSMLGNDQDGDCVTAAAGFLKQAMGILISDATCIAWATQNGVLNGADLSQVNTLMQQSGFQQDGNTYNEGPATNVDYTSDAALQSALTTSPVQIAIDADALPSGAGNGNGWYAFGGTPGSFPNTDHCVMIPLFAVPAAIQQLFTAFQQQYGTIGAIPWPTGSVYGLYTWAGIGFFDLPWLQSTCTEAHGYTQSNITVGTGTPTPDPVLMPTNPPPGPGPTPTPGPTVDTYTLATAADGTLTFTPSAAPTGITVTPDMTLQQLAAIIGVSGDGALPIPLGPLLTMLLQLACGFGAALPAPWNTIFAAVCAQLNKRTGEVTIMLPAALVAQIRDTDHNTLPLHLRETGRLLRVACGACGCK